MNVERQRHTRNGPHPDSITLMPQECLQLGPAAHVPQLNIMKHNPLSSFVSIRKGVPSSETPVCVLYCFILVQHTRKVILSALKRNLLYLRHYYKTVPTGTPFAYLLETEHLIVRITFIYSQKGAAICQ